MQPPSWPDLVAVRLPYGRDRAVTIGSLQEQLGVSRRVVEKAIEELRASGRPVCTGSEGVWLGQTEAEIRDCADALARRLVSQYRTVRAMRQTAQRLRGVQQTTLFGEVA